MKVKKRLVMMCFRKMIERIRLRRLVGWWCNGPVEMSSNWSPVNKEFMRLATIFKASNPQPFSSHRSILLAFSSD